MAQMNTDFTSGPLDYSSAEFKQIPLSTWILFYSTRISRISQIFPPDHLFFWTRIARIARIFFIWTIGLFHPHGKIRVHPCAKNIRDIRAIRVQRKNPCSSVSIRVPKTFVSFDSYSKKKSCPSVWQKHSLIRAIRVQRKNPCPSVCQKHSCYSSDSYSKKSVFICAICGRIK